MQNSIICLPDRLKCNFVGVKPDKNAQYTGIFRQYQLENYFKFSN
jgi:hypothetical protein